MVPDVAADRIIRWSTALAVVSVAVVAAVVSYEHASDLDSARRKTLVPALARWLLGLGIAATLAANVAHGLGHGPVGAVVAAWPAVALVDSYELLMMVIRSSQAAPDATSDGGGSRTHFGSRRPKYSPVTWQRIAFLQSARSALSSTLASRVRSGCATTLPQALRRMAEVSQRNQPSANSPHRAFPRRLSFCLASGVPWRFG